MVSSRAKSPAINLLPCAWPIDPRSCVDEEFLCKHGTNLLDYGESAKGTLEVKSGSPGGQVSSWVAWQDVLAVGMNYPD
jgi:hypothetical protein